MTTTPLPPSQAASGESALDWAKKNLFNSLFNSVISIVSTIVIAFIAWRVSGFMVNFFTVSDGDALEIVRRNLNLYIFGRYPTEYLYLTYWAYFELALVVAFVWGMAIRSASEKATEAGIDTEVVTPKGMLNRYWPIIGWVILILALTQTTGPVIYMVALSAVSIGAWFVGKIMPASVRRWTFLILVLGFIVWLGIMGGVSIDGFGLSWTVGWDNWSGAQLNLILTVVGITAAFPLGVLLAMGRRSSLPFIKFVCITFIEFVRGVPLISLLLLGQFLLGFAWPLGTLPADATRAATMISLFTAAYIAEIVRGGLQAVPKGQLEAGQALGLSATKNQRLIVLPQALAAVIPAMVGQFISLFKDTSLLTIIGILNALQWSRIIQAQPDFVGKGLAEYTLPFVGLFFWAFSYNMSKESRRLEGKLGVGER
jgi:general L-amino acid transport system permease protein